MEAIELKCEAKLHRMNQERCDETIKLIEGWYNSGLYDAHVLDIGPDNPVGRKIAEHFNFRYHHTDGDLNYLKWYSVPGSLKDYDIVLCLEVIEHLINPLLFLNVLKDYLCDHSEVIISFPYNWLVPAWGRHHFHEMDEKRFFTLIDEAGYRIIRKKRIYGYSFKRPFTGIRPMLRFLSLWWLIRNTYRYYYVIGLK